MICTICNMIDTLPYRCMCYWRYWLQERIIAARLKQSAQEGHQLDSDIDIK